MTDNYPYSPGIEVDLIDQGLGVTSIARGPKFAVLGTAGKGPSRVYPVRSTATAASEFGSSGDLIRGMYEVSEAGAQNVLLYRIGATSAMVEHIGDTAGTAGITISVILPGSIGGSRYSVFYTHTTGILYVKNNLTGLVVWTNATGASVDLGEVVVSGVKATTGTDVGTVSAYVDLEDITNAGVVVTAGLDNYNPSRMQRYEFLYKAYKELLIEEFDYIFPMSVELDAPNVADGDSFSAAYISGITDGDDYPTARSSDDILGKVFVEEYLGKDYFFWDLNGDGDAELFPDGVGSASSTLKINGDSLTAADFHEVNFAYQLARFCHVASKNFRFCLGAIGVVAPTSVLPSAKAAWIGKLPTYTESSTGALTIAAVGDNGSGLLGNKFMAGAYGFRSGVGYGGFILTDTEFLDGTEQVDSGGKAIDIGRYVSVVSSFGRLWNNFDTTGFGYIVSLASTYLGYGSNLDEQDAPTNKVIPNARVVFDFNVDYADRLNRVRYVTVSMRPKGFVILDASQAARPDSDYVRFTTMKIVKREIRAVRVAGDPFIGKSFGPAQRAALEKEIETRLQADKQAGYLKNFKYVLKQTLQQGILGKADLELMLTPAYELRQIFVKVSLGLQ